MSSAAKSICYFGYYLYLTGIALLVAPNYLLNTLRLPETNEVWIRVVGVLVISLGFYYHRTGVENVQAFFAYTIPVRIFVFLAFVTFVLADYVSPILIMFGAIDLAGAAWTWAALKKVK